MKPTILLLSVLAAALICCWIALYIHGKAESSWSCTSGDKEPHWGERVGDKTEDGNCHWENIGKEHP